jgi:hypothetical protein
VSEHVHDVHVTPTTFGSLRTAIDLPSPEGDMFEHQLNGFCWCQPLVEHQWPGGDLYIHRRSLDSPHIEVDV